MRRHQRSHTGERPFRCPRCEKRFQFQHDLKRHERNARRVARRTGSEARPERDAGDPERGEEERRMNPKRVADPPGDGERDTQPEQSQEPRRGHRSGRKSKAFKSRDDPADAAPRCVECRRSFPDAARLKTHNLRHEPRSCTRCGESFNGFVDLNQHYADAHDFRGPFPRTACDRSYADLRGLTRHGRLHTGDLPFACPKAFGFASALHDRTHTAERPYSCARCGKSFVQSYDLTAHARTHAGEEPYTCAACDRCFKSAGALKRHQRTHSGEKPRQCSACETAFRRPELVKAHAKKRH